MPFTVTYPLDIMCFCMHLIVRRSFVLAVEERVLYVLSLKEGVAVGPGVSVHESPEGVSLTGWRNSGDLLGKLSWLYGIADEVRRRIVRDESTGELFKSHRSYVKAIMMMRRYKLCLVLKFAAKQGCEFVSVNDIGEVAINRGESLARVFRVGCTGNASLALSMRSRQAGYWREGRARLGSGGVTGWDGLMLLGIRLLRCRTLLIYLFLEQR
eukprot:1157015-Pelagomonas_calceolata.AAC.4